MTSSDTENALRRRLRELGAEVDTAPDLEQRIARRRAALKRRGSYRKLAAVSGAVTAAAAIIAILAVSGGGHTQRVITANPPGETSSTEPAGSGSGPIDAATGRFTARVELDGGQLTITPAPSSVHPQIDQSQAKVLVGSDSQAYGRGWNGSVGFGEVSISANLAVGVNNSPAWVAIIKLPFSNCPQMTVPPEPVTTLPGLTYPPGYLAVIVEGTGTTVLDYNSRSQQCDLPASGPKVVPATQIVSIPWQLVSLHGHLITIRYQDPTCDPDHGLYSVDLGGQGQTGHTGIFLQAPYNLSYHDLLACGGPWTTQTYDYATGLGPGAPPPLQPTSVTHDPTGPVGQTS